jgi:hypothetical protein
MRHFLAGKQEMRHEGTKKRRGAGRKSIGLVLRDYFVPSRLRGAFGLFYCGRAAL